MTGGDSMRPVGKPRGPGPAVAVLEPMPLRFTDASEVVDELFDGVPKLLLLLLFCTGGDAESVRCGSPQGLLLSRNGVGLTNDPEPLVGITVFRNRELDGGARRLVAE